MEEVWKEIDGYPDYKVSTFGRVKRTYKNGNIKLLKPYPDGCGYLRVGLSKNNKKIQRSVHRLLGLTFLPNYYNLPQIDHKDRNNQNNSIYNLKWVSLSEQQLNRCVTRTDIEEKDSKKRKVMRDKSDRTRYKDEKQFYCEACEFAAQDKYSLDRHLNGPRCKKKRNNLGNP